MKNSPMIPAIDTAQNVILATIQSVGVHAFFIGLHNSFVHGKAFDVAEHDVPDEVLGECFKHFDELNKFGKLVEDEY